LGRYLKSCVALRKRFLEACKIKKWGSKPKNLNRFKEFFIANALDWVYFRLKQVRKLLWSVNIFLSQKSGESLSFP